MVEAVAGRLTWIDLTTGRISTAADGLAFEAPLLGAPTTAIFNGVAVGPSGAIYVTVRLANPGVRWLAHAQGRSAER